MLLKPSKYYILEELKKQLSQTGETVSILELGAGKADLIAELLKELPNIKYVGIEPSFETSAYAKKRLESFPNATIVNKLAYGTESPIEDAQQFDLVLSLSVLEHVKDLDSFFDFAAKHTKPNGFNIHLYDLGHSLHQSSLKERIQIILCDSFLRKYIPENKIASYVSLPDIESKLKSRGFVTEKITYHNMLSNVSLLKKTDNIDQLKIIASQEPIFAEKLPHSLAKEKLFPSICVWCLKTN